MSREQAAYLEDIRDAIGRIEDYTRGLSFEAFCQDAKTIDAVVRNLEVIGEAVKILPESLRSAHSSVDWRKVAGLRDVLIHQYFGIDKTIVWDVVQTKLAPLKQAVGRMTKGQD